MDAALKAGGEQAVPPPPVTNKAGFEDLFQYLDSSKCECLNEADSHPYQHCLTDGGGFLQSDCDEQLIISLSYNQIVKVHSLKVKAPADCGPKTLKVFKNLPTTLDFGDAESMVAVQEIALNPSQLDGSTDIPLKFVKFQNVQNIQIFIKDNQEDEEVTQVDYLGIFGSPIATTNMKDLKKAG
jgi:hypothetical protein